MSYWQNAVPQESGRSKGSTSDPGINLGNTPPQQQQPAQKSFSYENQQAIGGNSSLANPYADQWAAYYAQQAALQEHQQQTRSEHQSIIAQVHQPAVDSQSTVSIPTTDQTTQESRSSHTTYDGWSSEGWSSREPSVQPLVQPTAQFLSLLTRSGQSSVKDEPMDECDSLVLLPPPRVEYEKSAQIAETPLLTKMELTKKLREMVTTTSFALSSLEFRSAAASEANTDVCLEFLELNLKFFFSHVGAFNDMIQLLCAASDKYPSVRDKLRTLCSKVLKSAAVPPSIDDQIRKLAEGPAPATTPAKNIAPTKKPLDLTCATAEDLLETLIKRKNMTSIDRARIINRFVQLRPEIIDIQANSAEIDRQIGRVFGILCREGLDRLVAQLWLRASPETIDCILKLIMREYSHSISPSAVMDLLRHCSASPSYLKGLSREQLKVACAYMLEWATEEYPVHPSSIILLTQFIHQLIPITGHSLLVDLASICVSIDRSTASRDRRVAAAALLEELQKRFPCLDVSPCSSNISIKRGTHNSLSSADKELTALLSVLFACKDDSEVASAIDSLTNIIHFNKSIVLRQLPVMSRLIARISENPSSQIKEFRRFRWIINFLISSMMDLMHCISAENIVDIDRLLDGLLDFYQKHVSNTRDAIELSKRLLDLILSYLTTHRTDARDFVSMIGGDRVSGMLQAVRADEQYEEIQRVIDAM